MDDKLLCKYMYLQGQVGFFNKSSQEIMIINFTHSHWQDHTIELRLQITLYFPSP